MQYSRTITGSRHPFRSTSTQPYRAESPPFKTRNKRNRKRSRKKDEFPTSPNSTLTQSCRPRPINANTTGRDGLPKSQQRKERIPNLATLTKSALPDSREKQGMNIFAYLALVQSEDATRPLCRWDRETRAITEESLEAPADEKRKYRISFPTSPRDDLHTNF